MFLLIYCVIFKKINMIFEIIKEFYVFWNFSGFIDYNGCLKLWYCSLVIFFDYLRGNLLIIIIRY